MSTDTILQNAADEQLDLAVEENLFALFRAMTALPDSLLEEGVSFSRHLAFPNNPMYKGVWAARLTPAELQPAIRDNIAWFQSRNAPFFFWWTGPTTEPAHLGDYLTAQGLMDMETQSHEMAAGIKLNATGAPGMIADLQAMNETVLEKVPLGFEMYEVLTERDLQDFKRVLIEGYDMPTGMAEGWVQSTHGFGIGKTPWNMVLGWLNGEPVATNIILKDAGVVGVYGISVTPPARGKGIGAAITLQPLLDARDREGYNYAVLFSTEMGLPVYKRIGFRTTDVRINRYLWREG